MFHMSKMVAVALAVVVLMGSERLFAGVQDQAMQVGTQKSKMQKTRKGSQQLTSGQALTTSQPASTQPTSTQPASTQPTSTKKQNVQEQVSAKPQKPMQKAKQTGKQTVKTAKKQGNQQAGRLQQSTSTEQPNKKKISTELEELPQQ